MSYSFSIKSSNPFTNTGPTVEEPVSTPSETSGSTNASSSTSTSGTPSGTTTSATNLTSSSRRQASNTGLSIKTTSTAVEDYY